MNLHTADLFAGAYNEAFKDIMSAEPKHERWTFPGGRASCKSSFISICIVLLILRNPNYNALIIRKTGKSLRLSVFEQIKWAIEKLGVSGFDIPRSRVAALPITYTRKNGKQQQIIFAGCDNSEKIKSIKLSSGYIAILWTEEETELEQKDLQSVKISALRGGERFYIFESYNPPSAVRHWVNTEARTPDPLRMLIHTTYKDIPRAWLGPAILHDIEQTRINQPKVYDNIYLGIATGTGRNVFENLELREITDAEIKAADYTLQGIDWGYYPDPYAYGSLWYDDARRILYVYDELYLYKASNRVAYEKTAEHMAAHGLDINLDRTTADSAEPKSVADFRSWGAATRGAVKGPGSLDAGFKWLQGLNKIVIDPVRCPHAADEFSLYEHVIDKRTGEIMEGYPQGQPDHFLALTRYATESIWRHAGA